MSHCIPARYHVASSVEIQWWNSRWAGAWVGKGGRTELPRVLYHGTVNTVYPVINCLALICCSDRTSYSLNLRWYAVLQITLHYFWREQKCNLWMFLIKSSPPMQNPKRPLVTEEGVTSQGLQKDYTNTSTLTNTSWICTIPNTPVFAIHQVKLSTDFGYFMRKQAFS